MRRINAWLAILLVVMAPLAALAQGTGGTREQIRDPGHDNVSVDETQGSALARLAGDRERYSGAQRIIFVLLVTLVTVTVVFGIYAVAYAFRDQRARHRSH